jgi:hypothetical protein
MSARRLSTDLVIGVAIVLACAASSCGPGSRDADVRPSASAASEPPPVPAPQLVLATGLFAPIRDARLGVPVTFENELAMANCFPLLVSEIVVAWLADAQVAGDALLVNRCVEYDPSIAQMADNRHGGTLVEWERVHLSADRHSLVTTPLGATGWGPFANPNFCGTRVAYW